MTFYKKLGILVAAFVFAMHARISPAANVEVRRSTRGAIVTINGQTFAEYIVESGHQPVIWPIIGPGGQAMTRQFPLGAPLPGESKDHPHHRSLWFSHGMVNGLDFWMAPQSGGPPGKDNRIVHRGFAALESGDSARIVTRNDWTSDGKKVCADERTIIFGHDEHGRWIDFTVEVLASEEELTFGDTDEGSLGIRVPRTMAVDANKGGKIINSTGQKNAAAWGQPADWVDYHGSVGGRPAGIAMFCMADNFRHPCRWQVRPYGLFAANPFGMRAFPPGAPEQGAVTIPEGDRLRFHFRVLFYVGKKSPQELSTICAKYTALYPRRRPSD